MGEVQRYREGGLMYESEHGDYVRRADCVRLERELDELRRAFERAEADVQALSREVERLRKVEAAANELVAQYWHDGDIKHHVMAIAEACGRKG